MTSPSPDPRPTRRALLAATAPGAGLLALPADALTQRASAGAPAILKPLPPQWFLDYGSNAEMRWDSLDPHRYLTSADRLFVRNHTATPLIDPATYRLEVFGDGLTAPRSRDHAVSIQERASPWNTIRYRMTGGSHPADRPPLTVNPVRSAFELDWGRRWYGGLSSL